MISPWANVDPHVKALILQMFKEYDRMWSSDDRPSFIGIYAKAGID